MRIAVPEGTPSLPGGTQYWRAGIVFAIAIHAALAALIVFWHFGQQSPPETAAAITINLAPMASAPPVPETKVPEGPEQEETPPEEIAEPAPLPEPPLPREAVPDPVTKPEKKPEPVKKVVKETTAPRAQPVPQAAREAAPVNAAPSAAQSRALPSYEQTLLAHLERYKRYPRSAQRRGQEGVVYVRFEIDREGKLLSHSLDKTSGNSQLDQGGLDTVVRAEPFPPFPKEISRDTLDITVPIRFNLD